MNINMPYSMSSATLINKIYNTILVSTTQLIALY